MGQRLVGRDVLVLLFIIIALGSIAFLSVSATVSIAEAKLLLRSRSLIAWLTTTGAASFLLLLLLKSRRRAVDDQRLLRAFLDSAGDGIFVIDRQFIVRMWNPAAEHITGYPAQEVIGRSLRDVVSFYRERDRVEDVTFIEEAMLYGERRSMPEPMYLVRKDGTEVPIGDSAAPLVDHSGDVSGGIVIFRDATAERKQNALRSEFAYASHQLRTPVTKALWSLEAAMDKPAPEKEDLEVAYNALKSIRKLSNEILEVSEIDQGIVHSKGVSVNIAEAVDRAIQDQQACFKRHGVTAKAEEVSPDLYVHGDEHLLERVLGELLCNGSMYGRESGGIVSVSARREDGFAIIEVQDNGIGIPEDEQPLVFTKFFRGNNVDTSRAPGAGLGLYIAKGYVKAMGGRIWFKSAGAGSTFSFRLPSARKEVIAGKE